MSANFFVTQTNPEIFTVIPRPGGIVNIKLPERPTLASRLGSSNGSKPDVGSKSQTGSNVKAASKIKTSALKSKSTPTKSKSGSKTVGFRGDSKTSADSKKSILTVTTQYDEPIQLDLDTSPRFFKVKTAVSAIPWSVEFNEYLEPTEESKRIPDPFQDAVDLLAMAISIIMLMAKGYDTITDSYFKWVYSYLRCIKDEFGRTPPNVQGILNHINQLTGGKVTSFLEDIDEPSELGDSAKGGEAPEEAPADAGPEE